MSTKKMVILTIVFLVILSSSIIGYAYTSKNDNNKKITNSINDMVDNTTYPIVTSKIEEDNIKISKITPNTVIKYNTVEDGVIKSSTSKSAPYQMIGLTEEEFSKTIEDVKILSFTDELVVLEKDLYKKQDSYIIGEKDGYIAVFYKDENDNITLKNETKILIQNLPEEDKKLLQNGINAKNDTELIRIIEDYTS